MTDTAQPPTLKNWKELVQQAWGKEWSKPDPGYEFSNGRKFEDGQGVYQGTGT